jgi:hypothetical protein
MISARQTIWETLATDPFLVAPEEDQKVTLAENPPFNNEKGTKSRVNSIIPAGKAGASTKTPFITFMSGPRVKVDPLGHIFDEFYYIRCYNDTRKAYIEIDTILERIENLLDDANLSLADGGTVLSTLEATDPEREDEAMNLNYRESRYRVRIVQN